MNNDSLLEEQIRASEETARMESAAQLIERRVSAFGASRGAASCQCYLCQNGGRPAAIWWRILLEKLQ